MIPHLVYYQLVILVLLWLFVMLPYLWSSPPGGMPKTPANPIKSKRNRSSETKPFTGLTQKPHCALCERDTTYPKPPCPVPPDPMPQRPDVRAPWTPRCTFVPMTAVARGRVGREVTLSGLLYPMTNVLTSGYFVCYKSV
jgi:hypothetical protein